MRTHDSPRQRTIGCRLRRLLSYCVGLSLTAAAAHAQKITGVPGSPSATTRIDGKQLPPWPPRVVPPKGAPNVLLIMSDDQGYGVSGRFGGVIPTPALEIRPQTAGS
jgi:hypothetical protein